MIKDLSAEQIEKTKEFTRKSCFNWTDSDCVSARAFVVDFLNSQYCAKSMGYDKYSSQKQVSSDTSNDNIKRLRMQYLNLPLVDSTEMAKIIYQLPYFSRATLEDYTGLSKDDLKVLLKFLTTNSLVDKFKGDYRRLPLGTELFENLTTETITKEEITVARKDYYNAEY